MKKFLTVLLALSVVFTYTVGSAFALPSDGDDQAGLNAAKTEAVAQLDKHLDDIDQYTEVGQKLLEAEVLKGKTAVKDAKTIAEVKSALTNAEAAIKKLNMAGYLKKTVDEAIKKAKEQVKDYLYLFGQKTDANMTLDGAVADGNIQLDGLAFEDVDDFIADYNKALKRIESSASVSEVGEFLVDMLKVIDKYMNTLSAKEVTDAEKKALVDEIISYASSKNVSTTKYSAAIVAKYDAMVEEAVAAAKAVKTKADYYEVINKYLGSAYNGAVKSVQNSSPEYFGPVNAQYGFVVVKGGAVYLYEATIGELNKLVNMTKTVEMQIKAAEKVQAALGEYNYKDIAKDMWDEAETYRLGLAYFIENGDAKKMPANLKAEIEKLTATSKASEINAAVDKALAIYTVYTRLAQYKLAAMDIVNGFAGYEYDWTKASENSDYYGTDTLAQIDNLQELYNNYIAAADSIEKVDSYVDAYFEKADTYKTIKETEIAEEFDDVAAAIDRVVEETIGTNSLTADQKTLIDRIVADMKAEIKSGKSFPFGWRADATDEVKDNWVKNGSNMNLVFGASATVKYTIDDVVKDIIAQRATFNKAALYGYTIGLDVKTARATYESDDYGLEFKDIEKYKGYLDEAANKATSWSAYLAEYDKYVALCDAVETQASKEYKEAVKAAEAAISALGTVENTRTFEAKLDAAKKALTVVETKYNAMLPAEQVKAAEVSNEAAYYDAVYELAYLKYLASLKETPSVLPTVNAFYEIARGITNPSVMKHYAKADQNRILEIVTAARDAIDAAGTDAAKIAAAEKAISDLKAIATLVDSTDYTAALAANKAEAVKYFNKYYNAAFTSDAGTALQLIEDIIAFNDQFLKAEENAAKIKAVESLKIQVWTKLYTKTNKIRVNWKVKGDASAADGYYVYKSTKAHSNYKYMGKTKKAYMDNKKNLKKGKRYFYKVRAYVVVDGQKYFSDYSNKGNRIYK